MELFNGDGEVSAFVLLKIFYGIPYFQEFQILAINFQQKKSLNLYLVEVCCLSMQQLFQYSIPGWNQIRKRRKDLLCNSFMNFFSGLIR